MMKRKLTHVLGAIGVSRLATITKHPRASGELGCRASRSATPNPVLSLNAQAPGTKAGDHNGDDDEQQQKQEQEDEQAGVK